MKYILQLKNLSVRIGQKEILNNINFDFEKGKIYAFMGPNGSGKSTLAQSILGNPNLELDKNSKIIFEGKDIVGLKTEKRAKKGIFLSFQTPLSLTGVNIYQLLSYAFSKKDPLRQRKRVQKLAKEVGISPELLERAFDVGLSGGEKKKIEVLQALIFQPKLAILDEIDTGLDVDSLRKIAHLLQEFKKNQTFILITHYIRILRYLKPDYVIVLKEGKIIKWGNRELAEKIEKEGYQYL